MKKIKVKLDMYPDFGYPPQTILLQKTRSLPDNWHVTNRAGDASAGIEHFCGFETGWCGSIISTNYQDAWNKSRKSIFNDAQSQE